jgi:tetratricopeptide (TPR) repeat protein
LKKGNEVGRSGKGDCDDFSILLASLIESIGGTPRIIFAYNPAGGHAYTEVYLGKNNSKDLDMMMRWLRTKYNANDVNIHADLENGDVWLNMDWWKDSGGEKRPGGPFYHATAQTLVYTPDKNGPLTPIENLPPIALFNYSPIQPKVDEMVSFNAAQSKDPDGKIVDYEWNFGDGDTLHSSSKSVSSHVYLSSGPFQVNLTITDNQGDKSSEVMGVNVIDRTASSSNVTETDSEMDWIKKGDALNKLGRYLDAIQAYDKAINLNPRSFEAWTDKGNVFDSLGRYDEAILAYNKALEIYPNYDRAKASKELAQYNKYNAQYEASKPKGIPAQETNSGIPGYHWPGM